MHTYIAILRGINVSGHKMIKMKELTTLFESLDFKTVQTYVQSGNVVFQASEKGVDDLAKRIEKKIGEQFGFEVPVLVMEKNYMASIVQNNPFLLSGDKDVTKLHVTFLSSEPEKSNVDKINRDLYLPDEYTVTNSVVYLYCPNGYGNTKLNNNFFENKLKVTATTRNWKTVMELLNIANLSEPTFKVNALVS
jgi:uncharacterized protein (DUF1697 family)